MPKRPMLLHRLDDRFGIAIGVLELRRDGNHVARDEAPHRVDQRGADLRIGADHRCPLAECPGILTRGYPRRLLQPRTCSMADEREPEAPEELDPEHSGHWTAARASARVAPRGNGRCAPSDRCSWSASIALVALARDRHPAHRRQRAVARERQVDRTDVDDAGSGSAGQQAQEAQATAPAQPRGAVAALDRRRLPLG